MTEKAIKKNFNDKQFYENILKKDSNNYEAILKLGLIDVREKNFLSAKDRFKKLLKIDINFYHHYLNLHVFHSSIRLFKLKKAF